MAENTENQEPSMEEILASIRRIISEDGATVIPATPPEPLNDPPPVQDVPVLDLVQEVQNDGTVTEIPFESVEEPAPPVMPEPEPYAPPPMAPMPPQAYEEGDHLRLISDSTAQAAHSALLGSLAGMVRGNYISSLPISNGQTTLEGLVLELIRPVLKDWLDRNLPTLVERVVQKEIKKITQDLG